MYICKNAKGQHSAELRLMRPNGLQKMMELAQLIENRNAVVRKNRLKAVPTSREEFG